MWNPLSWVMEAAAIVAIALSNGDNRPPDYPDFIGIVILLFANATIGFLEERQAGNAVKALMDALAPECKVRRDGQWKTLEACELVPGDIISIKLGDVIPADGRLLAVSYFLFSALFFFFFFETLALIFFFFMFHIRHMVMSLLIKLPLQVNLYLWVKKPVMKYSLDLQ